MFPQRKKTIGIVLVVLAVVLIAGALYAYAQYTKNTPTETRGATGTGGAKTASGTEQPPSSAPSTQPTPRPTTAPGATPGAKKSVKPVISTLPYVAGGSVHLRAYAEGATGATCTVTLTHAGSAPVTATAPTTSQGVCQGFDLDATTLAKGEWTAVISVSSASLEGSSDEAKFTIN